MFRRSRRIPSFTLTELLVVLVLSSIMVGIIYFTYYTVSTYQMQLMRKQQVTEDISSLYFLLKNDVERSRSLVVNHALSITCLGENDERVDYTFDSLFVLRKQVDRVDTFHCAIDNPSYFFNKNSITKFPETIDGFEIRITGMMTPATIYIAKAYDAASLINLTKKDSVP